MEEGAARGEVTTRIEAWHMLFLTSHPGSTTRVEGTITTITPQTRGTTSISSDVRFAKIGRQSSDGDSSAMKAARLMVGHPEVAGDVNSETPVI